MAKKIEEIEKKGASLEELLPYITSKRASEAWLDGGEDAVFPCGEVIGRTKETLPIKDLVEKIMSEAEETSKRIIKIRDSI